MKKIIIEKPDFDQMRSILIELMTQLELEEESIMHNFRKVCAENSGVRVELKTIRYSNPEVVKQYIAGNIQNLIAKQS